MGAVVFICGCSSSYVHGHFHTCAVVFEWMRVSGVVDVDVLWSSRTVVVVVVVWSSWMHHGWGHRRHMLIGVMVLMASMVGVMVVMVVVVVATMVVVGLVIVLIRCCCWWAIGGRCQSCDGRMGTWGQNSPMMATMHAVVTI